jgi:hypothetical protein
MATAAPAPKRFKVDQHAKELAGYIADGDPNALLTTEYVASVLSVSCLWLELARAGGYGPPFVRIGGHTPRYRRRDVLKWLNTRSAKFEPPKKKSA